MSDLRECEAPSGDKYPNHDYLTHALACRRCGLHTDPTSVSPDGKLLDGDREVNAIHLVESMLRNLGASARFRVLRFCADRAKRDARTGT